MKKLLSFFFFLSVLSLGAQTITYDTITVSPDDERNIHLNRTREASTPNKTLQKEKIYSSGQQPPVFDRSKLRFGANFGLSISRNYTNLGFGPQVGYQFNQHIMTGTGVKYYYTKARTYNYEIKNNLLGANIFTYLYPVNFIALFIQPEINYIWSTLTPSEGQSPITEKGFAPAVVVGAGFRLGRSHLTLNYDLIQHTNSPHPDGFYVGVSAFF